MRNRIPLIITGIVMLIILAALILVWQHKRPKRHDWGVHYNSGQRLRMEPYGTFYLKKLLGERNGTGGLVTIAEPLNTFFHPQKPKKGTYIFLGQRPYYGDEDIRALLDFAAGGNTVFIGAHQFTDAMVEMMSDTLMTGWEGFGYFGATHVKATLPEADPGTGFPFWYQAGPYTQDFFWCYLYNDSMAGRYPGRALGYLTEEAVCYHELPYGKGSILIHTVPLFFTNYHLIEENGYRYVTGALGFIRPDAPVFFDEYSQTVHVSRRGPRRSDLPSSFLAFIINAPGLKWAWYLLVLTALLYVLLYARRRQRPMEVVEPVVNSSLEYIQAIGRIYLKGKNHRNLARHLKHLFMQHLVHHYGIRINQPVEALVTETATRSGIPEAEVAGIFGAFERTETRQQLSDKELMALHGQLSQFYTHCK